jgi:hypothetical protein
VGSVAFGALNVWLRRDQVRTAPHPDLAGSLLWSLVPEAVGVAIGYLLFPLVLSVIAWVVARLIRKPLSTETFMGFYTAVWGVMVFFSMVGAAHDVQPVAARDRPHVAATIQPWQL